MIGIISAMKEEMQSLLHALKNKQTYTKGMRTYYQGTLFDTNVVLVFSRWGKVASATTATQLINDFELTELIFTGVAGAITPNLNIGDVVIGTDLIQYDVDASPFFEKFTVPILNKKSFETAPQQRALLFEAAQQFISNYHTVISKQEATKYAIEHPKVIQGTIASGDQFINDLTRVELLNKELPAVECIEMEGGAVAQVCFEYNIPFSIIRIISDKAHDNAHIEFQKFADAIATKYALSILENYFS